MDNGSDPSTSRVVIVDDVRLARECLAAQLATTYGDIRCAWDLPSLIRALDGRPASIVLLNAAAANSSTLLQVSVDLVPAPKVIVFGLSDDQDWQVVSCAEAGAAGLHLRTESFEHLLSLMREIEDGRARCSPEVSAILLGRIYTDVDGYVDPMAGQLTARETEVLLLLEEGLSNKQIATRLSVTVHTVKNHVHSLLGKLGVQSRAEATKFSRAMKYAGPAGLRGETAARQPLKRSLTSVH